MTEIGNRLTLQKHWVCFCNVLNTVQNAKGLIAVFPAVFADLSWLSVIKVCMKQKLWSSFLSFCDIQVKRTRKMWGETWFCPSRIDWIVVFGYCYSFSSPDPFHILPYFIFFGLFMQQPPKSLFFLNNGTFFFFLSTAQMSKWGSCYHLWSYWKCCEVFKDLSR